MRRLSLLLLLHCSDGASMNVHSIVGYRAHAYYGGVVPGDGLSNERAAEFDAAIRENGPSVLGGSDFPTFCTHAGIIRTTTTPAKPHTGLLFRLRPCCTSGSTGRIRHLGRQRRKASSHSSSASLSTTSQTSFGRVSLVRLVASVASRRCWTLLILATLGRVRLASPLAAADKQASRWVL